MRLIDPRTLRYWKCRFWDGHGTQTHDHCPHCFVRRLQRDQHEEENSFIVNISWRMGVNGQLGPFDFDFQRDTVQG